MVGDEQLIRGHYRFAGSQRLANPVARRIDPSEQLDDDFRIGCEYFVDVFGPDDVAGKAIGFLAADIAVEDVRQDEWACGILAEDFGDRAADGAEAEEGDACFLGGAGLFRRGPGLAAGLRAIGHCDVTSSVFDPGAAQSEAARNGPYDSRPILWKQRNR